MKRILLAGLAGLVCLALVLAAPTVTHHVLPLSWTGEPRRLAAVLQIREGDRIAEIGAGSGAMARELALVVGRSGTVFATEISADLRPQIEERARAAGLSQIVVVEAKERTTNLATACCSAIYLRNVLHHIEGWPEYAADLARTVRPGGRIAVIDFAPGALFHLAGDHGAQPDRVIEAFAVAGLRLETRIDNWGGRTYLLAFNR